MSVELNSDFIIALINAKLVEMQDATPERREWVLAQIVSILEVAGENKITLSDLSKAVARLENPYKLVF